MKEEIDDVTPIRNWGSFDEDLNCRASIVKSNFIERNSNKNAVSQITLDVEMIGEITLDQLNELRVFILEVVNSMRNNTFDSAQINYKSWMK